MRLKEKNLSLPEFCWKDLILTAGFEATNTRKGFILSKFLEAHQPKPRSLRAPKSNRSGFTLIEMLVVIAIIALLVSLMVPSMFNVLERAKKVRCSSNLRQIGVAWIQYAADHNGDVASSWFVGSPISTFFYERDPNANFRFAASSPEGYLAPYLGEGTSVLVCPGTTFTQGVEAFCGDQIYGPCTYQGFTDWHYALRKIYSNQVFLPYWDNYWGWDRRGPLPIFMDPIITLPSGWVVSGGKGDPFGMVVHGNTGTLPILMDDGHVMLFDRSHYPPFWGNSPFSQDPLIGYQTQMNEILGIQ